MVAGWRNNHVTELLFLLQGLFAQGIEYVSFLIGAVGTSLEDRHRVLKVLAEQVLPHFK